MEVRQKRQRILSQDLKRRGIKRWFDVNDVAHSLGRESKSIAAIERKERKRVLATDEHRYTRMRQRRYGNQPSGCPENLRGYPG